MTAAHRRHRLLFAVGVLLVVASQLVAYDPALFALLLEPELVALMVGAGWMMLRADVLTLLRAGLPRRRRGRSTAHR